MKKAALAFALSLFFAGCAHYTGGSGSANDVSVGSGSSVSDRPHVVNDLDHLGSVSTESLQRAKRPAALPGP